MAAKMNPKDHARRRSAVERRDGPGCHWCSSVDDGTLDHVIPVSAGGSNRIENLVLACEPCNQERGGFHGPNAHADLVGKHTFTRRKTPVLVEELEAGG